MKHTLIITHNNQQQAIALNPKKPLKLKAKANTTYKIVDETGQIIADPVVKTVGDDVYVYLSSDGTPAFVLESYGQYLPITDAYALEQMGANLATSSMAHIGAGISSSALWTALGTVGVGGAVALSRHDKSDNANHNLTATTPIQTTPVVPPTPPAPIPAKVASIEVAQSVNESETLTATIKLDNANGAENIPFSITGLQSEDYGAFTFSDGIKQNTDGTLNIPKGVTTFTVNLPILADQTTENAETLKLTVGEQSKEVVVNDTSTTPIVVPPTPPTPTPAKVASIDVAQSINESETLTATIKLDNANGAENVAFNLSGLQAEDYGTLVFSDGVKQNTDGTLNIPKGVTTFTINLPILADNLTEGNETLAIKAGEQIKEVIINDTSTTPVVPPTPPAPIPAKVASIEVAQSVNESETLTATISLDNSNGAENVPFTITGLQSEDYGTLTFSDGVKQNTDGTLNIPKGVTTFTVNLPILADQNTENAETLTLTVGEQIKEVVVNDTSTTPIVVPPTPPAPIPAKVATVDVAQSVNESETLTATIKLDNNNGVENVPFTITGLQAEDYGTLVFSNGVKQNTDGTLNIPKGVTTFTVNLPILADNLTEGNEKLSLTVGEQSKEVIINDTSTTPVVLPTPAKVATVDVTQSINESETLTATIKLDNANGAENVAFNLSGLQAEDYGTLTFSDGVTQNTDGTLNIPKGVTTFTVNLPILADNLTEGNEKLSLTVGEQSKEVVVNDTSTTPIVVPPTPPAPTPAKVASIEVAQSANEGQDVVATVTLDNSNGAENVPFTITGLQAEDYGAFTFSNGVKQNTDGTLNIPKGVTSFTIALPILADNLTEGNEKLSLTVGEQIKEVTINDTSTTPIVVPPAPIPAKVASIEVAQSINESETLTATIKLDNANGAENVAFNLSGLQADDYGTLVFSNGVTQNTDGTLNIPKGVTTFTVNLPIIADNLTEGNETLAIKVGEQIKEVIINDTSTTPVVPPTPPAPIPAKVASIEVAQSVNESETLTATISLDNANGAENVAFNLSGLQSEDYGALTFSDGVTQNNDGTLNIPKGVTSFTVALPILADQTTENAETLTLTVGEQIKEVVVNDTSTTPAPAKVATVDVAQSINESQTLTATISLDNNNGAENVPFSITGLQADDYGTLVFSNGVTQNNDGTLNIPKGVATFTVGLPIFADNLTEGNETLKLTVGEQIKEVIINDTSTTPAPAKVASIEVAQSVNESETLTATIKLDNANGAENVPFTIIGLQSDDYGTLTFSDGVKQNTDGTLNIPKGVTTFTVNLPIIADNLTEGNETLAIKAGEQIKEVVVNDTSTTPIVVPPTPPAPIPAKVASIEVAQSVNESETLTATIKLDNANGAENVPFIVTGLQAEDYGTLVFSDGVTQNTDGTLNIPKGVATFTVGLPILADNLTEGNEKLSLTVGEQSKEVVVNDTSTTPSDTTAPTLTVTIDSISGGQIDLAESRQQHTLTGQLSTNEVLSEKSVTVKIDNQTYQANISTDGTTWTLPIAGDILSRANKAVVSFSGKDMAGNEASVSEETTYTVDLSATPLSVSIHAIDDGVINIADKSQEFTLTGKLTFDKTTSEQAVTVKINGTNYPALIQGDSWSLSMAGEKLAFAQGEQLVTVVLTAKDIDGQLISTQNTGTYNVDTEISTPVITFDVLADDNIINLAESGQNVTISGTVEHAKEGDIVKVMIGGVSKDVPLQGGKFTLTVAGDTLKTHHQISATVITTDTAGNTATGEQVKAYEVDTIAPTPKITLNPITGDNTIDLTEKTSAKTKITGQLTQIDPNDTNDLVLVCLCTTCTNNNKATFEAKLNADGTFSTEIDTAELLKYDSITATIKSTDTAGNTGTDTDTQSYKVAQDVPTNVPAITLNPIAGDNIVNSAEFNFNSTHPNIAITGKIERAEVENSSVKLEFYKAGTLIKTVDATLNGDGTYTYAISGAELHRAYDTVKAILTTGGQEYNHSQTYKAAAYSPRWGDIVPTFVSDDNVIDQHNTWHETTTITGNFNSVRSSYTAEGIENAMDITVTVNGKAYVTTVTGQTGSFTVNVKTADLLADSDKVADVSAYLYDNAGNNAGTKTATLRYGVNDTQINQPVLTVNPIGNINIAYQDANPNTTLMGAFELDGDVMLANAPLTIEIGGQTFVAQKTVTSSGDGQKTVGTWTLDVPTKTLIDANGNLTAKLVATDHAGNQAQTTTPTAYKVDVVAPKVEVKLNAITGDNVITPNEIADTFTITGTVAGEFNASDKVILTIGHRTFEVPVSQGTFSQVIEKSVIFDNTHMTARIDTADGVGNVGSDDDSLTYAVNTQEVQITFDPITTDNLINVSEQFRKLDVSGRVSGNGAKVGQTVEMSVGGQVFKAVVESDYSFKTQIDGELLAKNNGYMVSAKLLDAGNFVASTTHHYHVAKDVSAGIQITAVGDNTSDNGTADGFGAVRVSGKLAFNDSLFAQGYNEDNLQAIVIHIGGKSFNAGLNRDDYSFHIDLTAEEAKELNGLPITHQIITAGTLQYLAGAGDAKTVRKENATSAFAKGELDKITIDWHESATTLKNGERLINTTPKTTDITGVVSGSAQVGDTITVKVGQTQYQTKVLEGNTFKVAVDSDALKTANGQVEATLATKDLANNAISVTDTAQFGKLSQSAGEFVSKHTAVTNRVLTHSDEGYNFAYMIDSVATRSTAGFLNYRHTPFGGFTDNNAPATIKYYFATKADTESGWQYQGKGYVGTGSTRDFSDNLKSIVKSMLAKYESIANIRFEEVGSYQEVGGSGINFIYGDTIGAFASSGAFAYEGGNVVFDTANFSDKPPGNYHVYLALHELFHTFAGRHTDGYYEKLGYAVAEDYTSEFSIMSYSPEYHWSKGYKDLSLYDVMYMHYRFGVAKTINAGDDVYGFGNYASFVQDGTVYVADASGVDAFDASHESTGVTVNLTPGSWIYHTDKFSNSLIANNKITISDNATYFADQNPSSVSISGNINAHTHLDYVKGQGFIGYGTQIENLKGSNFADVLTGNDADNVIFGNDGDDRIDGGLGNDYLDGGKGADTLMGGVGDDGYVIDDVKDVITEKAGEGDDSVYSYINYSLGDELENLILLGVDNLNATGNDLNNTLIGNGGNNVLTGGAGSDVLDGGRGNDMLVGGAGVDYFRFSSLLDGSVDTISDYQREDVIWLDDDIFTALKGLAPSEVGTYVKYDSQTGQLSYDEDGAGATNAVHFATLNTGLGEQDIHYQII